MNTKTHLKTCAGNTLLVVMMVTGILSVISLGSYLALTSQENTSAMRSLSWNAALPLAEAGVEEALSQITWNTNNYTADNWANYNKVRTLGDGYYSVKIAGSPGSLVTITSTGAARWQNSSSGYLSRTVQVVANTSTPLNPVGMVAKNGISFGGNFGADSYDSTDPLHSTGGNYDPAKNTDLVTIATPGLGFSIGGSSHILGFVATGTGGTVTTKGAASVGSKSWASKGIEPGHQTNNFSTPLPDVVLPNLPSYALTGGNMAGTNYTYILNGNDTVTNLNAGGSGTSIYVSSPSKLVVISNVNVSSITFAPGATLDLYVNQNISFCPNVIGGTPPRFTVWATTNCTVMDMTGGKSFVGTIYAPQAALTASGNASICGTITSYSFKCNGTFDFHYDTSTAKPKTNAPVQIISWAEL